MILVTGGAGFVGSNLLLDWLPKWLWMRNICVPSGGRRRE